MMRQQASEVEAHMTAMDVAKLMRTCSRTVRRWGERGILHPVRLSSRCIRYRTSDVAAALERMSGEKIHNCTAGSL